MENSRSRYVYAALRAVPNRYDLCRKAAKGTRGIHTRDFGINQTMNKALALIAKGAK